MKRTILRLLLPSLLVLPVSGAMAQTYGHDWHGVKPKDTAVSAKPQSPTYSDVYCSGFLSDEPVSREAEVIGAWDTPHQTRLVSGVYVYLTGSNFKVGDAYSLVRRVNDPNRYEMFTGQHAALRRTGHMYQDIGRVRVLQVEGHTAITLMEFSCDTALPGDTAIAFVERPIVKYRAGSTFDRFAPPNGKLNASIVMAKDFDNNVAEGDKIYLNAGTEQGVKPGDYFRVVRTYEKAKRIEVDAQSYRGMADLETGIEPGHVAVAHLKQFPRLSIGEMVVLSVTKRTATALITTSLQDIHLGDIVELEDAAEGTVETAKAGTMPSSTSPGLSSEAKTGKGAPSVSCVSTPTNVHSGESATISCEGTSPDGRPLGFTFASDRGFIWPKNNSAALDTHGLSAGPVTVTVKVTDDRALTGTTTATVNVEPEELGR